MNPIRKHSTMIDHTDPGALVERPGPGIAPTAFRIWAAGENVADDGPIQFTEASAKALLKEQADRARRYSIDFDHLSLQSDRPATAGRAAGWHSLEVRPNAEGKPELWAVGIEWCEDAKAGLEKPVPEWRYFSPAFSTSKESGEVVSYVNLALCINPMTHALPSLAARSEKQKGHTQMDPEKMKAILAAMAEGADDEKKEALSAVMALAFPPEAEGDKKDEPKKEESKKAAEGEEPKGEPDGDEDKKEEAKKCALDGSSVAVAALTATVGELTRRLESRDVRDLVETRKDLPEATRKHALGLSFVQAKALLDAIPTGSVQTQRASKPTQGDTQAHAVAMLEGREREEMDRAMGMPSARKIGFEKDELGRLVLHTTTPTEARALIAAKKARV